MFSVVSSSSFFLLEFWVFWFCREFREVKSILDLTLGFFFSILGLGVVGCLGLCVFVAFFSWTGRSYQLLLTRVVLKRLESFLVMVWFFAF
jgi:hypothetical protein